MSNLALLVGINKYPTAPLDNCVNDIRDMTERLVTKCGFKYEDIRVLADARATTKNIASRLDWLVAKARPGDRVLFHYSGHGAQYAGRGSANEIDGLNEVICPVDFDWSPERMITDKQFVGVFEHFMRGVRFWWFSDSCHSGDLDRDFPMMRNSPKGKIIAKAFPTPFDMAHRIHIAREKGLTPVVNGAKLDVGFISGCKSNQTSADSGELQNGAFTYYLLKNWKGVEDTRPATQITAVINEDLRHSGYDQEPQADGPRVTLSVLS